MRTSRPLLLRALPAPVLLLLTACGASSAEGAKDADATDDASAKMPPIHVSQIVELLSEGENGRRTAYLQALDACQAAGLATTPLAEEDVAKVGQTRYQLWMDAQREVIRQESWDATLKGPDGTCHFQLGYDGSQETMDAKRYVQVDLATGEKVEEPSSAEAISHFAADPSEDIAPPGVSGPVRRQVAGQPCNEWTSQSVGNRQCVWSAGAPWGFTPGAQNDEYRPSRELIVLEQAPISGNGYRVTTETMTVGAAFDQESLRPERARIAAAGAKP
ncbi:hypothetical protein [Pseudoxanthomonas sp. UTMC 1351]|uniref:hypothetical protein n=1 Tax=Pseudoxanthomonas sp. UTMC 1351 TaxID=2695853 RepID=UPI0034CF7EA3